MAFTYTMIVKYQNGPTSYDASYVTDLKTITATDANTITFVYDKPVSDAVEQLGLSLGHRVPAADLDGCNELPGLVPGRFQGQGGIGTEDDPLASLPGAVAEKPALASGGEDAEGEPRDGAGSPAVRHLILLFLSLERADTAVGQVVRAAPHSGLPVGLVPPRAHAKRTTGGPLKRALA